MRPCLESPVSKGLPFGPPCWLQAIIASTALENGRILSLKGRGIRTFAFRDWALDTLIVTHCFQGRIEEHGNQANLLKEHRMILCLPKTPPINRQCWDDQWGPLPFISRSTTFTISKNSSPLLDTPLSTRNLVGSSCYTTWHGAILGTVTLLFVSQ